MNIPLRPFQSYFCHVKQNQLTLNLFIGLVLVSGQGQAQTPSNSVAEVLNRAVQQGSVVGAQILTSSGLQKPIRSTNLGFLGPDDQRRVTSESMFCIASCSKPLISAVIFALVDQQKLNLETPVGKWIPNFNQPRLTNGTATRSPNLRELLSHRGGIYSQKVKLNQLQLRAIRDFRLTLEQSVDLIRSQPLISAPGQKFAYSGAGYCLVGATAENATGKPIDTLLQDYLCTPAKMSSTTFFPNLREGASIATGGFEQSPPPHLLGKEMRLPLVGGSIHTTAEDLQRFARMIIGHGVAGGQRVLSPPAWEQYVSQPFKEQPYGYGWSRTVDNQKTTLSHNGSLPPAQASIRINLTTGNYQIVLWTLANPGNATLRSSIRQQVNSALR